MTSPIRTLLRPLAIVALSALPAAADQLPTRANGLWESTTTGPDGTTTAKQCVGDGTDAASVAAFGGGKACAKNVVTKTADGWSTESECTVGPVTAKSKGAFTGDFKTSVRTELETTLTGVPGQSGPTPRKSVIEARRLGDCEPGQNPGDIILSDGKVVKMPKPQ